MADTPRLRARLSRRRSSTEMRIEASLEYASQQMAADDEAGGEWSPASGPGSGSDSGSGLSAADSEDALGLDDVLADAEELVDAVRCEDIPLLSRVLLLVHELGRRGLLSPAAVTNVKHEVVAANLRGYVSATEIEVNALANDDDMARTLRTLSEVGGEGGAPAPEEVDD